MTITADLCQTFDPTHDGPFKSFKYTYLDGKGNNKPPPNCALWIYQTLGCIGNNKASVGDVTTTVKRCHSVPWEDGAWSFRLKCS